MKLTKNDIRKIINESFEFSGSRFGFKGPAFNSGKPNNYNPYSKYLKEEEEKEEHEMVPDAWSGGENLVNPIDYAEEYVGVPPVKEPEMLSMTEAKLRFVIKSALMDSMT